MPGSTSLLDAVDVDQLAEHPELAKLWLPSDLPLESRDTSCIPDLALTEYRMRRAQAFEALNEVRRSQRIYRGLLVKNKAHISTTKKTRSRGLFERFKVKVHRAVKIYRADHAAIKRLGPNEEFGPWKNALRGLRNKDIRGPGREKEHERSESRHTPSWIWFSSPGQSLDDADLDVLATPIELHDSIRAEWCRLQERLARFEEEVGLTTEEMRRVLTFFEWKACWWESSAASRREQGSIDEQTKVGIEAYAYGQAEVYRQMITVFVSDWHTLLESNDLASSWLSQYMCEPKIEYRRLVSNVTLYHPDAPAVSAEDGTDPGDITLDEGDLDFLYSLDLDDHSLDDGIPSLTDYDTDGI